MKNSNLWFVSENNLETLLPSDEVGSYGIDHKTIH